MTALQNKSSRGCLRLPIRLELCCNAAIGFVSQKSGCNLYVWSEIVSCEALAVRDKEWPYGARVQKPTGREVISRKSGTSPVSPNWLVTLSSVCCQTMVLKPISTLLNTLSELGTAKSAGLGSVRKLRFTPVVIDVAGVTASEAPSLVPITSEGSTVVPATS